MTGYRIDPTDLDQLRALIATVPGLDAVAGDQPAQVAEIGQPVDLPGVVIQVYGYTFNALDAYTMRGRLLLVVPDAPAPDARGALVDLLNLVATVVPVKGEVTHEAVVLPDRAAPLPALGVPFTLQCSPATEE